jgi:plastocyanin
LNLPATRPLAPSLSPVGNGGEGARRAGEGVRLLVRSIFYAIQYERKKTMKVKIKIWLGLIAVLVGLLFPVSLTADDAGTNSVELKIDNFNFTPPALTVSVGTKVTWVNKDDVPHTVTSDDKLFGSRAMDTDDKFSFTFQTPGTYSYYCSVHPKMTGKVIVR